METEKAINHFDEVIQLGFYNDLERALIWKGIIVQSKGFINEANDNYYKAEQNCSESINKCQNNYHVHYTLAMVQMVMGHHDEAIISFRRGLSICSASGIIGQIKIDIQNMQKFDFLSHYTQNILLFLEQHLQSLSTEASGSLANLFI